jgi:hypothetical protein
MGQVLHRGATTTEAIRRATGAALLDATRRLIFPPSFS